jgi:DNA-binding IclR family transcriptional regulator
VVRPLYEAERREAVAPRAGEAAAVQRSKWSPWARFERELDEVRRHGLGRAEGAVVAGVSAMSAPVFDHRGAMVLAITAIGPSAAFDARWSGGIAAALRDTATSVSARLGHAGAAMPVQAQNTATVGRTRRKPRS